MVRTARAWPVAIAVLGLAACADIWGFHDVSGVSTDAASFQVGESGSRDDAMTSSSDAAGAEDDGSFDGTVADGATDAGPAGDGSGDATTSAEADGDAIATEAGIAEAGGPSDALDEAVIACQAICSGCCDSTGHCQPGTQTGVCGANGALCEDCPDTPCNFVSTACCKGNTSGGGGTCGCATAALICN
jgi:hypothetical protein